MTGDNSPGVPAEPRLRRRDGFCLLVFGCYAAEVFKPRPVELPNPVTPEWAEMQRSHLRIMEDAQRLGFWAMGGLAVMNTAMAVMEGKGLLMIAPFLAMGVGMISVAKVRHEVISKRAIVASIPRDVPSPA